MCAGEAVHFLANLEGRVNVTSSSYCLSTAHGTIMGQPVAVIASGIGPGTAALCLMEILQCRYNESHCMTYHPKSIACKACCAKHATGDAVVSHLVSSICANAGGLMLAKSYFEGILYGQLSPLLVVTNKNARTTYTCSCVTCLQAWRHSCFLLCASACMSQVSRPPAQLKCLLQVSIGSTTKTLVICL